MVIESINESKEKIICWRVNDLKNILKNNPGFSLIELLVVIAIIGGLAGLLVPNYMGARERSRDTQRKSDLRQIQKAMEMYKQDQSSPQYPASDSFLATAGNSWAAGDTVYMAKIPGDPNRTPSNKYYYKRTSNLTYTLCACLENTADTDTTGNIKDGHCSTDAVDTYTCSSSKKYELNQP